MERQRRENRADSGGTSYVAVPRVPGKATLTGKLQSNAAPAAGTAASAGRATGSSHGEVNGYGTVV